jgi:Domain of unknown function (DUF3883)
MQFLLLQGGSDERNGDFKRLREAATSNGSFPRWSSLKHAKRGDFVFFYISAPISAIVATGRILSNAHPGRDWRYEARVGEIGWLKRPVSLAQIRGEFPDWKWPEYPRAKLALNPDRAMRLLTLTKAKVPLETAKSRSDGGGFGNPEQNFLVEQAAVRFATQKLKNNGYSVKSVEKENRGFDLRCRKARRELHVEVKGNSGLNAAFIVTQNELSCAKSDPDFRLALVNGATGPTPRMTLFTQKQLLSEFSFTPVSFIARKR